MKLKQLTLFFSFLFLLVSCAPGGVKKGVDNNYKQEKSKKSKYSKKSKKKYKNKKSLNKKKATSKDSINGNKNKKIIKEVFEKPLPAFNPAFTLKDVTIKDFEKKATFNDLIINVLPPNWRDYELQFWIDMLRSPSPTLRFRASVVLTKFEQEEAVEALAQVLGDENIKVDLAFERALVTFGKRAEKHVLDALRNDYDYKAKWSSLDVLSRVGTKKSIDALNEHVFHENMFVRRAAVQAIGKLVFKENVNALTRAMEDKSRIDIIDIIRSLVYMRYREGYDFLISEFVIMKGPEKSEVIKQFKRKTKTDMGGDIYSWRDYFEKEENKNFFRK